MTCTYCGRGDCHAQKLSGSKDAAARARCRDATKARAERAEAEVRACCGKPEALDPYLPDGWTWNAAAQEWHGPHGLAIVPGDDATYREAGDDDGPIIGSVARGVGPLEHMRLATSAVEAK